jgi:formiminoglutamase
VSVLIEVQAGGSPLIVSLPHTGTEIPKELESRLNSPWLARKDTDWWLERLYDFAINMDATVVRTTVSRSVIDVNRDPSGASLYPDQATTTLCPLETFDGEALYQPGHEPSEADISGRRADYFDPFHETLQSQLERLLRGHPKVVLYDAHSIRSMVPRLFDGPLPHLNLGTNSGASCDARLSNTLQHVFAQHAAFSQVANGRFKGGWITRHYGRPQHGVHAVQLEIACRSYMTDPAGPVTEANWPPPYDPAIAAPLRRVLAEALDACLAFARTA